MPQVRWSAVTEHVGWIVSNLIRCSNSCSAIHSKEGGVPSYPSGGVAALSLCDAPSTGNSAYSIPCNSPRRLGKGSPLARAPPVQNPTVPFGRPPGTAITGRHRNGGSRRRRGRSIEVAGHCIGRTDPLLDHPCHLDDPRRVTHPGAHLVTGRHYGRRLGRPIVDPHMPTSACRGGVRPGFRQPDRPQPPIHAG